MISADEIKHIAKLARLRVSPEEVEGYRQQLGSIIDYVKKLQELDTKNVPETQHAPGLSNVLRDDEIVACDPEVRRRIIEAFPRRQGDLLEVQAVFEDRE